MKRSILLWQLLGLTITSILGTLLHFLYEWCPTPLTAIFSGVNESTWEHMKLFFWPSLAFAIFQYFFFSDRPEFWCVKLRGTLLGLVLIPAFFYGYNGIIGKSPDWLNISIFFISAAIAYFYEGRKFKSNTTVCKYPKVPIFILSAIALFFIIFTFAAPQINVFKDPLTQNYGIM